LIKIFPEILRHKPEGAEHTPAEIIERRKAKIWIFGKSCCFTCIIDSSFRIILTQPVINMKQEIKPNFFLEWPLSLFILRHSFFSIDPSFSH